MEPAARKSVLRLDSDAAVSHFATVSEAQALRTVRSFLEASRVVAHETGTEVDVGATDVDLLQPFKENGRYLLNVVPVMSEFWSPVVRLMIDGSPVLLDVSAHDNFRHPSVRIVKCYYRSCRSTSWRWMLSMELDVDDGVQVQAFPALTTRARMFALIIGLPILARMQDDVKLLPEQCRRLRNCLTSSETFLLPSTSAAAVRNCTGCQGVRDVFAAEGRAHSDVSAVLGHASGGCLKCSPVAQRLRPVVDEVLACRKLVLIKRSPLIEIEDEVSYRAILDVAGLDHASHLASVKDLLSSAKEQWAVKGPCRLSVRSILCRPEDPPMNLAVEHAANAVGTLAVARLAGISDPLEILRLLHDELNVSSLLSRIAQCRTEWQKASSSMRLLLQQCLASPISKDVADSALTTCDVAADAYIRSVSEALAVVRSKATEKLFMASLRTVSSRDVASTRQTIPTQTLCPASLITRVTCVKTDVFETRIPHPHADFDEELCCVHPGCSDPASLQKWLQGGVTCSVCHAESSNWVRRSANVVACATCAACVCPDGQTLTTCGNCASPSMTWLTDEKQGIVVCDGCGRVTRSSLLHDGDETRHFEEDGEADPSHYNVIEDPLVCRTLSTCLTGGSSIEQLRSLSKTQALVDARCKSRAHQLRPEHDKLRAQRVLTSLLDAGLITRAALEATMERYARIRDACVNPRPADFLYGLCVLAIIHSVRQKQVVTCAPGIPCPHCGQPRFFPISAHACSQTSCNSDFVAATPEFSISVADAREAKRRRVMTKPQMLVL